MRGTSTTADARASFVRRERLVSRLLASAETPMVLITAPAGFGKSTVLREWRQADSRPFATLTLTPRHDDPVLLLASIAEAVAARSPVDDDVYSALFGSRAGMKVAVPRLLDSLRAADEPLVLALDDAHAVGDRESLELISAIALGLPHGSQLAIASRREPAIPVGRLRANRDLIELEARDLAFTEAEAAELFEAIALEPESVRLLVERTEGWPAALYLATLSLLDSEDPDADAQDFAGDDRVVADYLRDELVSTLSAAQLDFLTRTSILDEVSGDLCDTVLEANGSAETLRELARANSLVVPLDVKDRAFRYHALLREMLTAELRRRYPAERAGLHTRASTWYSEHGDFDRAIPHAIATGDVDFAGELMWEQVATYSSAGREATVERWLAEFSEPQIAGNVALCLTRATCGMTAGNGAEVDHWTGLALDLLERMPGADAKALGVAAGAIRAAGSAREGVVKMGADAVAAFELLPDHAPWRALCRFSQGASLHLTGANERARAALEDGARRGAVAVPSLFTLCSSQLALLAIDEGDPDEAATLSAAALDRTELNALADQPTEALVFAVGAFIEARAGDSATASRHARHAVRLLGGLTEISAWYDAESRIVIARALALLDDVAEARAQLAEAGRRMRQAADAPVLREWLEQAWKEADSATVTGRWPLTPAELRLLHFLPTHLSFPEIAEASFVSQNTVKTQARSIYRKLGVGSRAEAVATARTAGLIDD